MPGIDYEAENIGVGKGNDEIGGYLHRAPIGTTLPTDATTALGSAFEFVSVISRDGVTTVHESETIEENDWADKPIFTEVTNEKVRKTQTLLSNTMAAAKCKYGDTAVTGTAAAWSVKHGLNAPREEYIYVWETLINKRTKKRSIMPRGKVTANDNVQEQPGETLKAPITITGLYDDTAGYSMIDYYAVAQASSGTGN